MAEIKHTFQGGRMNKDVDERLLPNNEYRDALNVEVITSSSGDIGSISTMKGNTEILTSSGSDMNATVFDSKYSKFICSINDEKTNRSFFFLTPEVNYNSAGSVISKTKVINITGRDTFKDVIACYDDSVIKPVVVDIFEVHDIISGFSTTSIVNGAYAFVTNNINLNVIKPNMEVTFIWESSGGIQFENENVVKIDSIVAHSATESKVVFDKKLKLDDPNVVAVKFRAPRVLNFHHEHLITGVNIIDDLLFWTDNRSEPKKINISRCMAGSLYGFDSNTSLFVTEPNGYGDSILRNVKEIDSSNYGDLREEHLAVIKKAPKKAPKLIMSNKTRMGNIQGSVNLNTKLYDEDNQLLTPGETFYLLLSDIENITMGDYIVGDIILFETNVSAEVSRKEVRAEVIEFASYGTFEEPYPQLVFSILSISSDILNSDDTWSCEIEQPKPLFEFKFSRFACRYKYEDGEYSSFSPWSELAFIPDAYDYEPKEGYNLGMVNTLRKLTISDFIGDDNSRPGDVVSVDVLYKDTVSPNVYVVKSITRGRDPEWITSVTDNDLVSLRITSEMIHTVVPSDQSIRVWDNVPRTALAQEITGNRLIYGNYLQGYDIPSSLSLYQTIVSKTNNSLVNLPSIKSLRKYKVGVVLGDKYGRETPVISNGTRTISNGEVIPGDVNIDKEKAKDQNRLIVRQHWDNSSGVVDPPEWVNYCKYYVKETSGEYYNLSMDRVYDAEDGNVWLSFMSSDRNKIMEDDYLVLKKTHKSSEPVTEPARYKILAIENDAPLHIKTEHRTIAELDPPGDPDDPADLYLEQTLSYSNSPSQAFRGFRGLKGTGYSRITLDDTSGKKYKSAWKKIASINSTQAQAVGISDSAYIRIVDANYGDTAKLDTIIVAEGGTVQSNTWKIEVKDTFVENRPEFDGRFFVKILRDSIIERDIIENSAEEVEYHKIHHVNVAHISTNNTLGNSGTDIYHGVWNDEGNTVPQPDGWFGGNNDDFDGYELQDKFCTCGEYGNTGTDTGYQLKTKNYWKWRDNEHGSKKWFIDNAKMVSGHYPRDAANQTIIPQGIVSNPDGDGSRMWLSYAYKDSGSGSPMSYGYGHFSSGDARVGSLMGVGKFFKFSNDPQAKIYKVVGFRNSTTAGHNYHHEPWQTLEANESGWGCNECDTSNTGYDQGCGRQTLEIDFVDVTDFESGIDLEYWDPRSQVKFDGSQTLGIDFLAIYRPSSEPIPASINSAVFETEPREIAELDIYYEASNALPIRLSKENIDDFAPKNSLVKPFRANLERGILAWQLGFGTGDYTSLNMSQVYTDGELQFANDGYGDVRVLHNSDNNITVGRENADYDQRLFIGATVGDVLSIEHGDGTITESAVAGHVEYNADGIAEDSGIASENCWLVNHFSGDEYSHSSVIFTFDQSTEQFWTNNSDGSIKIHELSSTNSDLINPHTTTLGLAVNLIGEVVTDAGIFGTNNMVEIKVSNFFGEATATNPNVPQISGNLNFASPASVKFSRVTGTYSLDRDLYKYKMQLPWYNCYTFGNGVESDRIRDDFNSPTIGKGFKASTTLDEYGEERRGSGLVHSGIYNSTSGVNRLNEFNMGNHITKDLNPSYGSIQALKSRDTNLVTFCEDKVLKILANKDALFNADGSTNLTSTSKTLGSSIAFAGDYGISKNPESLAVDGFRMYFADKQRGKVLRLSQDGLTPISDIGMNNWFASNTKTASSLIGSYDEVLQEYNLTLDYQSIHGSKTPRTISFNERIKGWTSFRSYILETGISMNSKYVTGKYGKVWLHHNDSVNANTFYGVKDNSTVDILFNQEPSTIKSFNTMNYEGSQAHVTKFTTETVGGEVYNDNNYDNLTDYKGWYVSSFTTDMQSGKVDEFKNKEGKWFNHISGVVGTVDNLDSSQFATQGIGIATTASLSGGQTNFTITIQNDPNQ